MTCPYRYPTQLKVTPPRAPPPKHHPSTMSCTHAQTSTVQPPAASATVYKDDCMFCFDTPESPLGLDICLSCHQSFSRGAVNHTSLHFEQTTHALYVNIKKTLKRKEESPKPTKIAKLEVRELSEAELFDTVTAVYCAECDATEELAPTASSASASQSLSLGIPPGVQRAVEGVLRATSSAKKQEIKAWEQEVVPCEHALYLSQVEPVAETAGCVQCPLEENLWLCLQCGAKGCGRAQFGGVLGNSHALSHYEATGHAVALKLGSLSLDSSDCFCYKCSDEVQVPELPKFLSTYGIDVASHIKTEKNLIELQLDQNMQWEFSMETATGALLRPVFGPHLTGLRNLGNSCYLNSVMQVLMLLPSYQRYFKEALTTFPTKVELPAVDLHTQLVKLYEGLASGRYSHAAPNSGYQSGIKPTGFKTLIAGTHAEFASARQQDAFEFWLHVIEKLEGYFHDQGITDPLASPNGIMKFVLGHKLVCQNCQGATLLEELVENLSVPIKDTVIGDENGKKQYERVTLMESLEQYTTAETVADYTCDRCATTTLAIKATGFSSFPEVLVVSAQRIKLENWVPVKVDVPVEVSAELCLESFRAPTLAPGEILVESRASQFTPNSEALNTLLGMGFPENRCLKGLSQTGNTLAEEAMNWLFAHMDDPDIDAPFVAPTSSPSLPLPEAVENLVSMGFSALLATKALVLSLNDPNQAVEWLFAHPDDSGTLSSLDLPRVPQAEVDARAKETLLALPRMVHENTYELTSVICHKGSSVHTGHYVAFVKKEVDGVSCWVLYNDEKVVVIDADHNAENVSEMEKNGYLYVFTKK